MVSSAPRARRIPFIAALIGGSNLLSAGLGYVRESLIAAMFGAGPATDAYFSAFRLPDLLNYFLAGSALSIAFLPRYTNLFVEDQEKADRFLGVLTGTIGAVVVAVTILLWFTADPLVRFLFGGFDAETLALTTHLTRIVLPAQIAFVVGGILKVGLFARDRFLAAALAPVIYNLSIIAGGLLLGPSLGIDGFAWGVLIGAFIGPLGAPLIDLLRRMRVRLAFAPTDPEFHRALLVAVPLMLGVSLLTVDEWYLNIIGSRLGEGDVSHLIRARLLMRLPIQVVGGALGAASLPALTRLFAEGNTCELNSVVLTMMRAALGIGILGGAGMVILGEPITRLLFERGAFTAHDTAAIVAILHILALGVPMWLAQQMIVRAYYARSDTWRPMVVSTIIAVAAFPVYWQLGHTYGTTGLAAAGAASVGVTTLSTLALARWLHGAPSIWVLLGAAARTSLVAVLAGAAAWGVRRVLPDAWSGPGVLSLPELVVAVGAFGVVALTGTLLIGDPPTREVVLKILRKLGLRLRS